MAIHFYDAHVELGANDLSTSNKSVTLGIEAADLDTTTMGNTSVTRIGGLKDGSLQLEFNQSFTASELDAILFPLIGTVVTFKVRATSAAIGTSNPEYRGSVLITEYSPFSNAVGEVASVSVSWPTTGAVTRHTA